MEQTVLSNSNISCSLGVLHLKRYWEKINFKKTGKLPQDGLSGEWTIDITLLAVLGLGLEQTIKYLYDVNPPFNEFETWILNVNGGSLSQDKISEFNQDILNHADAHKKIESVDQVLSGDDLDFWNENGYVIIHNAVSNADCESAIDAICSFIDIKKDDASTWYGPHPHRLGIMIQLFQHAALEKNRRSPRIRAGFEQLWQRKDLWLNTDRAGFNPPETSSWKFPGPRLHWDVSLELPIPFGLQGILYLSDTATNQGAFTLVPGFQSKIEKWLMGLPASLDPRTEDIYALGAKPIAANTGDFIIWHQALPHGSSPNTSSVPRFVQYINYAPLDAEIRKNWK